MKNWNALDRLIGKLRYLQVNKYVAEGRVIADVGCGREGVFLKSHKDKIKYGYGFDFRIEDCVIDNIELINNRNMEHYPVDDDSVDTVFLNAVLEHLTAPLEVLSECYRILKHGGNIVMTTPTKAAQPMLEFMAFKLHIINEDEILEHQHYYDKKDIQELAGKLNMMVERYSYFEFGFNSIIVLKK